MTHLARLNPRYPATWESPHTLRFGFEKVITRIEQPSKIVERFLQSLRSGASFDPHEPMRHGVPPAEWTALMRSLAPVLIEADSRARQIGNSNSVGTKAQRTQSVPTVAVLGEAHFVAELSPKLEQLGCRVVQSRSPATLIDLGVTLVTIHSFLTPDRYEEADLASLLPTLPIRLTDRSVWVGPYVFPQASPCSRCAALHDVGEDPHLAVVAAQLIHRIGATVYPDILWRIACIALTTLTRESAREELKTSRLQFSIAEESPHFTVHTHQLRSHPWCTCGAAISE